MEITEVRIKFHNRSTDRLKAYCTITFDDVFVVRDVKIVEGTHGLFVAMPSRKLAVPCPKCRYSNPLRSRFCSACGAKFSPRDVPVDPDGRVKLHRDIAHPITGAFREYLQTEVLEAFETEQRRAQEPGYQPSSLEPKAEADQQPFADTGVERESTVEDGSDVSDEDLTGETPYEPSEYDSLIADLRGGVKGGEGQPKETRSRGAQAESTTTQRSREGAGDRGQRGRRSPRGRGRSASESRTASDTRPRRPARGETPKPISPGETVDKPELSGRPYDSEIGHSPALPGVADAEVGDELPPAQIAGDQVILEEAIEERTDANGSSEDTSAFGAGIL